MKHSSRLREMDVRLAHVNRRVALVAMKPSDGAITDPRVVLSALDAQLAALDELATAEVRAVRRLFSRELRSASPSMVLRLAKMLIARDGAYDRFLGYELIAQHHGAMASLGAARLRELGRGMDSWSDVDMFGCYLAGPAWFADQVSDEEVARWARSRDRWWRRAALVSTVGLNARARATEGPERSDRQRTLTVCRLLQGDRDPMVVKALSWALRELAKRAPTAVSEFVRDNASDLPALVRREVRSKLTTGRKTKTTSSRAARRGE